MHVHPPPTELVGIGEPREVRVEEFADGASRVVVAQRGVEERTLLRVALRRDRLDDRVLAVEVAVERAVAEPGFGCDVVGRRPVQPPTVEAGDGGVEDGPSPGRAVLVAHLRHQDASARATW